MPLSSAYTFFRRESFPHQNAGTLITVESLKRRVAHVLRDVLEDRLLLRLHVEHLLKLEGEIFLRVVDIALGLLRNEDVQLVVVLIDLCGVARK